MNMKKEEKMMKENNSVIQTDCFAYRPKGEYRCIALNDLYCAKEECHFYKPKNEVNMKGDYSNGKR